MRRVSQAVVGYPQSNAQVPWRMKTVKNENLFLIIVPAYALGNDNPSAE
jgi:hypothetical protein